MNKLSESIRRIGFSVLSSGEDGDGRGPIADIVFVHGLGGHPEETWSTRVTDLAGPHEKWRLLPIGLFGTDNRVRERRTVFWPRDLLPRSIGNARIMTYGYEADPVAVWSHVNIFQHSRDLLIALAAQRSDNPSRPLIFVTHNLGGILVKDVLSQSKTAKYKPELLPIHDATHGIIFMSVPHRGSSWDSLAKKMSALVLGSADIQAVRGLDVHSETLERLRTDFAVLLKDDAFKIHTFQETEDMVGIPGLRGKIVEPFSCVIDDAREQVQTLSGNHTSMCKFSGSDDDNYNKVHAIISGYVREIEKITVVRSAEPHTWRTQEERSISLSTEERKTIARWLSSLNFKTIQSETLQKCQPDTGQWLLKSPVFIDWRDRRSGTLWCPGIPGAGKTIMASIVIDHLQTTFTDNVAVLFIYCNYKEKTEQTVSNLTASLLKQIVQDFPGVSRSVKEFYEGHQQREDRPTLEETTKVLKAQFASFSNVFIIVDALDECSESDGTRADLVETLQSLRAENVNLMITSRDIPSINLAHDFEGAKRLDIRARDKDVQAYIESRISRYRFTTDLKRIVMDKIVENAKGMFLLARLHLNSISRMNTRKEILRAIMNLPKGVDETYDDTLDRIYGQDDEDKELANRVLSWISLTCRPLFIQELRYALSVKCDMKELEPDDIILENRLTSVCAGLVIIEKKSRIVRLVHYTTQEYFDRKRESLFPNAQADIAITCLTYLSFDVFSRGGCDDEYELESLLEDNPFLDYAAHYWGHHARGQAGSFCKDLAVKVLQDDSKVSCISQLILLANYNSIFSFIPKDFLGIHLSSFLGLEKITESLLLMGAYVDLRDTHGRSPLSYAAERGRDAVVKLLLDRDDIDVNSKSEYGRSPLSHAAEEGHDAVVKLLLARDDVDANSKDRFGQSPLTHAAFRGHDAVVKLLLARDDIDVNSKDQFGWSPLTHAARGGHDAVVKLLLSRDDVDVNSKDISGLSALDYAILFRHRNVVELLRGMI